MRYLSVIILLFVSSIAFSADKFALKVGTELGSSYTTGFIGGGFIMPELGLTKNLLSTAGLQITNEKKVGLFLLNELKIPYKKWEFYLIQKNMYNRYVWNIQESVFFFGVGLKVDRFDAKIGVSARVISPVGTFKNSIFEPWNLQYDIGVSVFPKFPAKPKKWNLRLGISNFDAFYFERAEVIILSLKGDYHFTDKWSIFCQGNFRPAGNFHMAANYYSFYFQTGFRWAIF